MATAQAQRLDHLASGRSHGLILSAVGGDRAAACLGGRANQPLACGKALPAVVLGFDQGIKEMVCGGQNRKDTLRSLAQIANAGTTVFLHLGDQAGACDQG